MFLLLLLVLLLLFLLLAFTRLVITTLDVVEAARLRELIIIVKTSIEGLVGLPKGAGLRGGIRLLEALCESCFRERF